MTDSSLYKLCEFLIESNAIENEHSIVALETSLRAWRRASFGINNISDLLDVHFELMCDLDKPIAGNLREGNVSVSGRVCPAPWKLQALLEGWFRQYGKADTEESIKKAHVAFERIHPFFDGNGRTGRIIMNYQRLAAGLPLLIIHTGMEQAHYYSWFD